MARWVLAVLILVGCIATPAAAQLIDEGPALGVPQTMALLVIGRTATDRFVVNMGRYDGLYVGARLVVLREGRPVAEGTVINTDPSMATAQITGPRAASVLLADRVQVVSNPPLTEVAAREAREARDTRAWQAVVGALLLGWGLID